MFEFGFSRMILCCWKMSLNIIPNLRSKSLQKFFDIFIENESMQIKDLRSFVSISSFYEVICPEVARWNGIVSSQRAGMKVIEISMDANEKGRFSLFVRRNPLISFRRVGDLRQPVICIDDE